MKLKGSYKTETDVPEDYIALFTEQKDGEWKFTGLDGLKTQADVNKALKARDNEVAAHKETKKKFEVWGDLDYEEVQERLDRIPALEAAAGDKLDDAKVEELIRTRTEAGIKSKSGKYERDILKLTQDNEELATANSGFQKADNTRRIRKQIRTTMTEQKVRPEVADDVLLLAEAVFTLSDEGLALTREAHGFDEGLDPTTWLTVCQEKRSHWWGETLGGGAGGSRSGGVGGKNWWSAENWNATEQAKYYKEKGAEAAARMAKAAGTTLGGARPASKKN